jgi:hypothetical protein
MDLVSVFCGKITLFPETFVEEAVYSPLYVFDVFVKNKLGIAVWIYIWVLYSVPLVSINFLFAFVFASTMLFLLL